MIVEIDVRFDSDTNEISWTFRSLDPSSGLLPADPFAGFLPPNDDRGAGEGFVSYLEIPSSVPRVNESLRWFPTDSDIFLDDLLDAMDVSLGSLANDVSHQWTTIE